MFTFYVQAGAISAQQYNLFLSRSKLCYRCKVLINLTEVNHVWKKNTGEEKLWTGREGWSPSAGEVRNDAWDHCDSQGYDDWYHEGITSPTGAAALTPDSEFLLGLCDILVNFS